VGPEQCSRQRTDTRQKTCMSCARATAHGKALKYLCHPWHALNSNLRGNIYRRAWFKTFAVCDCRAHAKGCPLGHTVRPAAEMGWARQFAVRCGLPCVFLGSLPWATLCRAFFAQFVHEHCFAVRLARSLPWAWTMPFADATYAVCCRLAVRWTGRLTA
jgi:hypothetical protein